MGFWPYFLQEYSSGGMSAILELIAGTRTVFFTPDFLEKSIELRKIEFIRRGIENQESLIGTFASHSDRAWKESCSQIEICHRTSSSPTAAVYRRRLPASQRVKRCRRR